MDLYDRKMVINTNLKYADSSLILLRHHNVQIYHIFKISDNSESNVRVPYTQGQLEHQSTIDRWPYSL